jgi:phenylalanyl-tRNA synthetase beta chain
MRVPLSWIREYVDITIPVEQLAHRMTLAGLEISAIDYVGIPAGKVSTNLAVPISTGHLVWDREKLVIGHILEVKAHPNADKLVLAMVESGIGEVETVVTGAPNLYPYKDQGPIKPALVTVYAREGAEVIDGHKEDGSRLVIKPRNLRGIDNKSMVCSAKELGLWEDHEGIMLLDSDAKPGTPAQDVLGDVILTVEITPNLARCLGVVGIAREVAALTGQKLHPVKQEVKASGPAIKGQAKIDIKEPELNPRFTLALIKGIEIKPSPEWMQRRLRQAGMRPINNIVDITNYVMLETGQPLHAFDYDVLVERAGGKSPTIITRLPNKGEKLTTLDGVERTLDPFTILVCDQKGALSLGGIMGGAESEIYDAATYVLDATGVVPEEGDKPQHGKADSRPTSTTNVLLESASWNLINIRQTLQAQRERGVEINSEAGYRFSRGVHPAMASVSLLRAIQLMQELGGGEIASGIVDEYPKPAPVISGDLPVSEVERQLGIAISEDEIARILEGLEFDVKRKSKGLLHVTVPDHRLDIGVAPGSEHEDISEIIVRADLVEDVMRIYGYDRLHETMIDDVIPPQHDNPLLKGEEQIRDLMVGAGLQEIVTIRLTTWEAESRLIPPGESQSWPDMPYVTLANPISADRTVFRHTLVNSMLETMRSNARWRARQALFEIGKVYWPVDDQALPDEPTHLCIALTGERWPGSWEEGGTGSGMMDFYDLKGIVEALVDGLHLTDISIVPAEHTTWYPGRTAALKVGKEEVGTLGELHPLVHKAYDLPDQPVLIAEVDIEKLIGATEILYAVKDISNYPAIYQDIAVIVDENVLADQIEGVIREAGGWMLVDVRLFDVYRGEQIGAGKKSLAYGLTFQANDRTLKDKDADKQRDRIVRALDERLGAKLRS